MDGALSRLGRNTELEPFLGALFVFVLGGVSETSGAEVLGAPRTLDKVVFLTAPRSLGVENAFCILEVLWDAAGEDLLVLLEILGLGFSPVGEMHSLTRGSGAEFEVRWDSFELPAVGSGKFII
jgi:hypothetical protein